MRGCGETLRFPDTSTRSWPPRRRCDEPTSGPRKGRQRAILRKICGMKSKLDTTTPRVGTTRRAGRGSYEGRQCRRASGTEEATPGLLGSLGRCWSRHSSCSWPSTSSHLWPEAGAPNSETGGWPASGAARAALISEGHGRSLRQKPSLCRGALVMRVDVPSRVSVKAIGMAGGLQNNPAVDHVFVGNFCPTLSQEVGEYMSIRAADVRS